MALCEYLASRLQDQGSSHTSVSLNTGAEHRSNYHKALLTSSDFTCTSCLADMKAFQITPFQMNQIHLSQTQYSTAITSLGTMPSHHYALGTAAPVSLGEGLLIVLSKNMVELEVLVTISVQA